MALPTKKITQLIPAVLPISGDEDLEAVQMGESVQIPARAFAIGSDSLLTVSGMGGSLPGSRQLIPGPGVSFTDTGPTGTLEIAAADVAALPAEVQEENLPAGTTNDLILENEVGFLELSTPDGPSTLTGIVAIRNGQILIISNLGPNPLTLAALNAGSAAAARFRMDTDLTFMPNASYTFRYSSTIGVWISMS